MGEVSVELVNDGAEENAENCSGEAFTLKDTFSDGEKGKRVNGAREEQGGVSGFPEEGHNWGEVGGEGEEGLESLVAEHCPKGIFDVSGDKDMVWTCRGKGAEVVDGQGAQGRARRKARTTR